MSSSVLSANRLLLTSRTWVKGNGWICHSKIYSSVHSQIKTYIPRREISIFPSVFKNNGKDKLGCTTILFQDGVDIQELPVIVRKTNDVLSFCSNKPSTENDSVLYFQGNNSDGGGNNFEDTEDVNTEMSKRWKYKNLSSEELEEMKAGFDRCYAARGIFALLETVPAEEVTPEVAVHALKRIIELENNHQFRNEQRTLVVGGNVVSDENFTRTAILNQLVDTICECQNSRIILEGLRAVTKEALMKNDVDYHIKLVNELLVRTTEGKFCVDDVCDAIHLLASVKNTSCVNGHVDKMWVGLTEKESEINEFNVTKLVQVLPLLKQSRSVVFALAEKKLATLWWRLGEEDVKQILIVLASIKCTGGRMMSVISRWVNLNIHTISESTVLSVVQGFIAANYYDANFEKALERYTKAKCLKISDFNLVTAVADYCNHFRLCSQHILDGISEYFIRRGSDFAPFQIRSVVTLYGTLDYHPGNGFKFWQKVEEVLSNKLVQFTPRDLLDTLLACVYLKKYPLNFVKQIFNPYFLDRLHSSTDPDEVRALRVKLKLFDTILTLECPQYRGPMLPRDSTAKSVWRDGRVMRAINILREPLINIAGGEDMVSASVVLPQLPISDLTIIDLVIHPPGFLSSMMKFGSKTTTAVLIRLPDHYCVGRKTLVGPQAMRTRLLQALGFKVVSVDFESVYRLKVHPAALEEYLKECLAV